MKSEVKESQGRPIIEWYEQLPEPIRGQAIENYNGDSVKCKTLERAIAIGFSWYETNHGWNYWADIANRARLGEFDNKA